jgi:lipoyl(octanoyl) transferase
VRWAYLGQLEYRRALELQQRLRTAVLNGESPGALLLLEHPPVITVGSSTRGLDHVLISDGERARRGVDLVRVSRGGDVTYHGPGQLVGYPIRKVGRAVKQHVRGMAQALVNVLGELGIDASWENGRPGVWTGSGKIAAVGVDARTGVTIHGFALNVRPALADFAMIVPCGLQAPVTSVAAILGEARAPSVEELARRMARELAALYGTRAEEVSPTELWGGE